MKRIIFGVIIGLGIGTTLAIALAKYESTSLDAKSVVAYGKNGTDIIAVQVTTAGALVIQ